MWQTNKEGFMKDLDIIWSDLKYKLEQRKEQIKDAYDMAESYSAKIKLWFMLNKMELAIYGGFLLAGIIIGTLI
jgi:hypothetical protein